MRKIWGKRDGKDKRKSISSKFTNGSNNNQDYDDTSSLQSGATGSISGGNSSYYERHMDYTHNNRSNTHLNHGGNDDDIMSIREEREDGDREEREENGRSGDNNEHDHDQQTISNESRLSHDEISILPTAPTHKQNTRANHSITGAKLARAPSNTSTLASTYAPSKSSTQQLAYTITSQQHGQQHGPQQGQQQGQQHVEPHNQSPLRLSALVKQDYDTTVVKTGWLNTIVNKNGDIDQQNLKIYRVELKGSFLHLYKPASNLNIKSFKLDNNLENEFSSTGGAPSISNASDDATLTDSARQADHMSSTSPTKRFNNLSDFDKSNISISSPQMIEAPIDTQPEDKLAPALATNVDMTTNSTAPMTTTSTTISTNSSANVTTKIEKLDKMDNKDNVDNIDSMDNMDKIDKTAKMANSAEPSEPSTQTSTFASPPGKVVPISYFSSIIPHPQLRYDFHTHRFTTYLFSNDDNTLESIIHFFFFTEDPLDQPSINTITSTLPLLPNFGQILQYIGYYLETIFDDKFELAGKTQLVCERTLVLLSNLETHFDGFLLNSDVGPSILRIVELLSQVQEFDQGKVSSLKQRMLIKQQGLIDLVNNSSLAPAPELVLDLPTQTLTPAPTSSTNSDPFKDLSSLVFMKDVNLIEFAKTISDLDLKYFSSWNSNIDKSLLLASSINTTKETKNQFYKKNPLIFNNNKHIHYLSRLLINHIFVEQALARSMSFAILESKARILEKWIDLGCLLDKSGNMSSWLGISSIILSQPVLRLTKIWSLVSNDYIKLLKNDWSPVLFELDRRYLVHETSGGDNGLSTLGEKQELTPLKESYHIMAPRGLGKIYAKERVIPYFSDLVINNLGLTENVDVYELESIWKRINYSFDRWNDYLSNLNNHDEIIKYNEDVLRRYDTMGFIFSNESLNQILYLGGNNDEDVEPHALRDEMNQRHNRNHDYDHSSTREGSDSNAKITEGLLRLIEVNCNSIDLEQIMKLSLNLEPDLPEGYLTMINSQLVIPSTPLDLTFPHKNQSSLSVNSVETQSSLESSFNNQGFNPSARLPTFNNNYFKLDFAKYDELAVADDKIVHQQQLDPSVNKHNLVIDDELTFRIDDFVTEVDSNGSGAVDDHDQVAGSLDGGEEEDLPGLGIDVDDILSSEKFNNFTISPKSDNNRSSSSHKHSRSHSHSHSNSHSHSHSQLHSQSQSGAGSNVASSARIEGIKTIYSFVPKYATIDRLIDLLLIDATYFHNDVHLDLTEYRFVFLLNYNSFMTTKELLDKLVHRFVNSGNAVLSVMKKNHLLKKMNHEVKYTNGVTGKMHEPNFEKSTPQLPINFPNWDLDPTIDLTEMGEVDYELLLKIQINILKVLIVLLNNFYSNFSLNLSNKSILIKLLKLFSNEILQWYNSNKIDASLERLFESLVSYYKKLKKLFVKKTYRPNEISKFDEYLINEYKFNSSLSEVPMNRNLPSPKNVHKIEKFLYKFNKLLTIFYKGIKAEDWVKAYKILENLYELNALWDFNLQRPTGIGSGSGVGNGKGKGNGNGSGNVKGAGVGAGAAIGEEDEKLVISNIFNFFETLVSPEERQLVLKQFPLVFRKLFKLYFRFKTYLLVQLTDPNITTEERLERMKTLLLMTKISKLKMNDNQFVFEGNGHIPSCVETAIINVIYSPESRMFSNLWVKAALALDESRRNSQFNSIEEMIPLNISVLDLQSTEPLLPCFGWIIENLIASDKCPSFYKKMVNFNKRYLIFKLIKELGIEDFEESTLTNSSLTSEATFHESREFDFLLKLNETLVNSQLMENVYGRQAQSDKAPIFFGVLREQQRILLMDNQKKYLRDTKYVIHGTALLSATSVNNFNTIHGHNNNSSGIATAATNTTTTTTTGGSGGNFRNHNIHGIHGNDSINNSTTSILSKKSSNNSLKRQSLSYKSNSSSRFKISGLFSKTRPFLSSSEIVSVKDLPNLDARGEKPAKAHISISLRNRKIFPVYQLQYSFKIDGDSPENEFFFQATSNDELNDWLVKLNYANRHWFYSKVLNFRFSGGSNSNNLVFGLPLEFICIRERMEVPTVINQLLEAIESEGLDEVGVYRISTSLSEINNLKNTIDRMGCMDDKEYDTHTLTSTLKVYFRMLPDSILTDEAIERFYIIKDNKGFDEYREILQLLPKSSYNTLKRLIKHLVKVCEHSETNKMTTSNIATVIGPTLTEASSLDILIHNFGFINLVLEKMILNYDEIFE